MISSDTLLSTSVILLFALAPFVILERRYLRLRRCGTDAPVDVNAGHQLILEHADTAYVLVDRQLRIITFNGLAARFTMATSNMVLAAGRPGMEYFHEARREDVEEMFRNAFAGTGSGYEIRYPDHEGAPVYYEVQIQPVRSGEEITGVLMSMRDITEKKMFELQREKMTQELIQHNRSLEQFTYIVSHNLRAPLSNIIGLSQVLNLKGLDEEQQREFLEGIAVSSRKLDEVIIDLNSILHLRNSGEEKKEPVRFRQLLEDVRYALANASPGVPIHIISDFSAAERMLTVKSYLYSIFYNLVSNSIKYRRPGTDPVIRISSRMVAGRLELRFSDNGSGIDMERNGSKVFGLYKRFHPDIEGKGMGLYMTRIQVEKLGGSISVESVPGKGTTFNIRFL